VVVYPFQWINRELQRLDRLIDKANEKGWPEYPCCMSYFDHALMFLNAEIYLVPTFIHLYQCTFGSQENFILCCYILDWWHFTKHEYLDKKQLLRKPSEQQRLLEEVPRVIPDMEDGKETEVQVTTRDLSTKKSTVAFQGNTPRNCFQNFLWSLTVPSFQIVGGFGFPRSIDIIMHLVMHYI
jgi:hypothetical protein